MLQRPSHLVSRQIQGRAFSEAVSLIRTTGTRNEFGEYSETETGTDTLCATAPVTSTDPRARMLMEGGVQLDAMRIFWMVETPDSVDDDSAGDILLYESERWRVEQVQRWGGFVEVLAVRQEVQ